MPSRRRHQTRSRQSRIRGGTDQDYHEREVRSETRLHSGQIRGQRAISANLSPRDAPEEERQYFENEEMFR